MRFKIISILVLIIMTFSCTQNKTEWKGTIEEKDGVKIIKNPEEPISGNIKRRVHLIETLRIRDNGKDIIFRWPENLVIDKNENIFFLSSPHLYKYDKDGNFVFKIIGEGQGPGEADPGLRKHFAIINDEIMIRAISPPKIMIFGLDGILKREIKMDSLRRIEFIGGFEKKVYAIQQEISWELKGKSGYIDFPTPVYEFSPDFQEFEKIHSFPIKVYFDRNAWFGQAYLEYAIKDFKNFFVVHHSEYKIIRYNLKLKRIEEVITRDFERIKRPKRKKKPGFAYSPDKEYYQDIQKLLIYGDYLWAITSEKNEENEWLIDVFDKDGKYVDNFFLSFPADTEPKRYQSIQLIVSRGFLYSVDQDKEGYYSIAKYIIGD